MQNSAYLFIGLRHHRAALLWAGACSATLLLATADPSKSESIEITADPFFVQWIDQSQIGVEIPPQIIEKYEAAIKEFPTIESCSSLQTPSGNPEFSWKTVLTDEALEVCLFRFIGQKNTANEIANFFISEGWGEKEKIWTSAGAKFYGESDPILQIGFFLDAEKLDTIRMDAGSSVKLRPRFLGIKVTIYVSSTHKVLAIRVRSVPTLRE